MIDVRLWNMHRRIRRSERIADAPMVALILAVIIAALIA